MDYYVGSLGVLVGCACDRGISPADRIDSEPGASSLPWPPDRGLGNLVDKTVVEQRFLTQ